MSASADPPSAARPPEQVLVRLPITLGQFLKAAGLVHTGGEAKYVISSGLVTVNGESETRRGRHLDGGDTISCGGETAIVMAGRPGGESPDPQEPKSM